MSNEYKYAVDVVEDRLSLAILAHQVVAPGGSVQNLEVAARIWITTACVVGIVFDLSTKYCFTRSALHYVQNEQQLEVDVKIIIDWEVLDIQLKQLLLVEG